MVVEAERSILDLDLVVDIEEEVRVDNRLVGMVVVPSNVCRTWGFGRAHDDGEH